MGSGKQQAAGGAPGQGLWAHPDSSPAEATPSCLSFPAASSRKAMRPRWERYRLQNTGRFSTQNPSPQHPLQSPGHPLPPTQALQDTPLLMLPYRGAQLHLQCLLLLLSRGSLPTRGHVTISGHISGCHNWVGAPYVAWGCPSTRKDGSTLGPWLWFPGGAASHRALEGPGGRTSWPGTSGRLSRVPRRLGPCPAD